MNKKSIYMIFALLIIAGIVVVIMRSPAREMYMQEISRGDITNELSFSGIIKPLRMENYIFPFDEGTVESILKQGDKVSGGSVLYVISSKSAEDNLRLFEIEEERNRSAYENFAAEYERIKKLFESGSVGRDVLRTAENSCQQTRAAWEASSIKLTSLKKEFKNLKRKAEFSGRITDVNVFRDQTIHKGEKILTVVSDSGIRIEGFLSEYDRARVEPGLEVEIIILYKESTTIKGRVESVSSSPVSMGIHSGQYRVIIEPKEKLADPLYFAECGIAARLESYRDVTLIPARALINKAGKKYILGVKGSRAYPLEVQVDDVVRGIAVISEKLEFDKVVLDPEGKLLGEMKPFKVKEKKDNEIEGLF